VLKPRFQAGAIGIKKIRSADELWHALDAIGDKQSFYVLEQFVPGQVHHVDSIVYGGKVLFSIASQYGTPPIDVAQQGRVFTTRTMVRGSPDERALRALNGRVLSAYGLRHGVSHTEFIKSDDGGRFHFLETSARVGGAHIVDLVEAATGLNLWAEWAKMEVAPTDAAYELPVQRKEHAGLMISLARQQWPDLSGYDAREVVWRLQKEHHAGLIVRSRSHARVTALLEEYTQRFYDDFFATAPPKEP
jgi:biotin carboxylase